MISKIYATKKELECLTDHSIKLLANQMGIEDDRDPDDLRWLIAISVQNKRANMTGAGEYYVIEASEELKQELKERPRPECGYDAFIQDARRMSCDEFKETFLYEHRLGKGKFGDVYRVEDQNRGEMVAIKKIEYTADNPDSVYINEYQYIESLLEAGQWSDNIANYIDHFIVEDCDFLPCVLVVELEYIKGESLKELLARSKPFKPTKLRKIACGILKGLKFLHENEIVHRDLHAGNVMVDEDNRAVIVDYSLSCQRIEDCDLTLLNISVADPRYTINFIDKIYKKSAKELKSLVVEGDVNLDILIDNDTYAALMLIYQMMQGTAKRPLDFTDVLVKELKAGSLTPMQFIRELDAGYKLIEDAEELYPEDPRLAEIVIEGLTGRFMPSVAELLVSFDCDHIEELEYETEEEFEEEFEEEEETEEESEEETEEFEEYSTFED